MGHTRIGPTPPYDYLLDVVEEVTLAPAISPTATDLEFAPSEFARRCQRARAAMRELGIDAVVLSAPANVRYFTGLRTWLWKPLVPTVAIICQHVEEVRIVAGEMDAEGIAQTAWPDRPWLYDPSASPATAISAALVDLELGSATVGFELGIEQLSYLAANVLIDVARELPDVELVDAIPVASVVRMLKSEAEIERLRTAARLTEEGFAEAFAAAREGATETELSQIAASRMILDGSTPGFAPLTLICRAGPPSYPQLLQPPGEEPVRRDQQIFFDGGCEFRGYQTDIMRSAVIGALGERAEAHLKLIDDAIDVAIARLAPGEQLGSVRLAVSEFASEHGVGSPEEIYGIGHGIGLDRWELPLISTRAPWGTITARVGMVLCVEPSLGMPPGADKHDGLFLMEDEVVVTSSGAELVSCASPRSLRHLS
jgi:Xaa-Pro dipeptidase